MAEEGTTLPSRLENPQLQLKVKEITSTHVTLETVKCPIALSGENTILVFKGFTFYISAQDDQSALNRSTNINAYGFKRILIGLAGSLIEGQTMRKTWDRYWREFDLLLEDFNKNLEIRESDYALRLPNQPWLIPSTPPCLTIC